MRILDLIGNTPLIELCKVAADIPGVRLMAKAEFCNPSGSVKDRAACAMILDGIKKGTLTKDKTIVDATSGNTGIAYAMIGASLGYSVTLYMPRNASPERKRIILSYGAEIVGTDPLEGSDGAFLAAQAAVRANPGRYFYPDQYNNPENPKAHYETTGAEIWAQTERGVTHFISGMGTSGTFMGVSRRLKDCDERIKAVAVQPNSPFHGIEGAKHMESTIKPGIYDESVSDGVITVTTEAAYEMTRRLAREEGVFVGVSSGANVSAAVSLSRTLPEGSVVVTVLCDNGTRYLSDPFWEDSK
ncbi:MAG: cysteine synthase family protein [Synergistaceae bacterium]|jgi:cysteine synthase B|nr:cysteine synthase family protein [Synergistaceae bacterium]